MGRTRIPDAPAAFRRGRRLHTASALTTAWIAIIPLWARGMTEGEPRPGRMAVSSSSLALGAFIMRNAPSAKLDELTAILPGLGSPSVIPLAHNGMIAIHAVVNADAVWSLLPRLKAAGASGILVLPIEKIVA